MVCLSLTWAAGGRCAEILVDTDQAARLLAKVRHYLRTAQFRLADDLPAASSARTCNADLAISRPIVDSVHGGRHLRWFSADLQLGT
jgi:hypothetical protein